MISITFLCWIFSFNWNTSNLHSLFTFHALEIIAWSPFVHIMVFNTTTIPTRFKSDSSFHENVLKINVLYLVQFNFKLELEVKFFLLTFLTQYFVINRGGILVSLEHRTLLVEVFIFLFFFIFIYLFEWSKFLVLRRVTFVNN